MTGQPPKGSTGLGALTQHLQALAAMDLPPEAQAMLAHARADLRALAAELHGAPAVVDPAMFQSLLALAGPQVAPDLLRQLAEDLAVVADRLTPALGAGDRDAVRAQTHILLALAGSVGATGLYQMAERLNLAANSGGDIGVTGPAVLDGLAQLRRFIDDTRDAPKPNGKA